MHRNERLRRITAEREREIAVAVHAWRQLSQTVQDEFVRLIINEAKERAEAVESGDRDQGIDMYRDLFAMIGMGTVMIRAAKGAPNA